MERHPSLFLQFFCRSVLPCRHVWFSAKHCTIPTSLLVLVEDVVTPLVHRSQAQLFVRRVISNKANMLRNDLFQTPSMKGIKMVFIFERKQS